ncbi:MAG: acyl-CoA dehydrogenase [Deltaproteobacteria bacterium]|nr:acyl-CoA dehydrogenase [Deltaproteobacteria bacterium]
MMEKFYSHRNLRFLLYDVHRVAELTAYEYYADHDQHTFDSVLDAAGRIGKELFLPYLTEMDKKQPTYEKGQVRVHPVVREVLRVGGEGGWIAADFPYEHGGQQLPVSIASATQFIFDAANFSAAAYWFLTGAAARLLTTFGSAEVIAGFVAPMLAGRWQGTMALTEPQAGSSLADVRTKALPAVDGTYRIHGQKIFTSAGEHDAVDNVVHLVLARIQDAPPGIRGISLFVVPKLRHAGDGGLEPNDVVCTAVYHKLGYRGCPITQLSFGDGDDCRGYLVGEPHQGLTYMFSMMNEARLATGIAATAVASAAYYSSLAYALERLQGRPAAAKGSNAPQVPIAEHADVRRMLLFQRSVVEGSLSLLLQCARYADLAHVAAGEERERAALLLDLLTPVAKSYPSEMGVLTTSQALQILGGYGYCDEFPLEQLFRDMRIHPIHEGTTGIQGLDLLGRKVRLHGGKGFALFGETVRSAITAAGNHSALAPYAARLDAALSELEQLTAHLYQTAGATPEVFLADATLYLELFGLVAVAWQWLQQGAAIRAGLNAEPGETERAFLEGKWTTFRYYFHYEVPKSAGLVRRLFEADGLTVHMTAAQFQD